MKLFMNDGDDSVTLTLVDAFAPTSVDGGTGADSLTIDDTSTSFPGDSVSVTGSAFARTATGTISFGTSGVDTLQINTEPAFNSITVAGTSFPTTLNGIGGDDSITVGSGSSLDSIDGSLVILGGAGADTLTLDDASNSTNSTYRSGTAPRAGVAAITFHSGGDIENLVINAGNGADVLSTKDFTGSNASLNGQGGNDTLEAIQTVSSAVSFDLSDSQLTGQRTVALTGIDFASLTGADSANLFDLTSFTGTVTLRGGLASDTFTGTAFNDLIDGGGGIDRLVETGGDFVLSDTQLIGRGTDALVSIEEASLTGNGSANTPKCQ